jgi:hypothetical protein
VNPKVVREEGEFVDGAARMALLELLERTNLDLDPEKDAVRWVLAKLPRSMGGLGWRNPSDFADQSYVASIIDSSRTANELYGQFPQVLVPWKAALDNGHLAHAARDCLERNLDFFTARFPEEYRSEVDELYKMEWKEHCQRQLVHFKESQHRATVLMASTYEEKVMMQVATGAGTIGSAFLWANSGTSVDEWVLRKYVVQADAYRQLIEMRLSLVPKQLQELGSDVFCPNCSRQVNHVPAHVAACERRCNTTSKHDAVIKELVRQYRKTGLQLVPDGQLEGGIGVNIKQPDITLRGRGLGGADLCLDLIHASPYSQAMGTGPNHFGPSIRRAAAEQNQTTNIQPLHAAAGPHAAAHIARATKFKQYLGRFPTRDDYETSMNAKEEIAPVKQQTLRLPVSRMDVRFWPMAMVVGGGVSPEFNAVVKMIASNTAARSMRMSGDRQSLYNTHMHRIQTDIGITAGQEWARIRSQNIIRCLGYSRQRAEQHGEPP